MSHAAHRPGPPAAAARVAAAHADTAVPGTRPEYEGLVTRAIAFSLDAALINVVAIVVGAAIGLTLSVLSVPDALETALIAIGGAAYLLWSILYFVTFWSTTGQTPGNRLLGIRVCRADDGELLGPLRAAIRLAALTLCAIPLFAGFLPILVDDRRRGAHDMLVGSVVVGAPGPGEPPPP